MSTGGRNLALLGLIAIIFAFVATAVELHLYRSTGDIYLDRSRPGFLPDPEEVDADREDQKTTFVYSDSGPIDADNLSEYLKELKSVQDQLKKLPNPFSAAPLSDESLGITTATPDKTLKQ